MAPSRLGDVAVVVLAAAVAGCSSSAPPPPPALWGDVKPVVSVKELMKYRKLRGRLETLRAPKGAGR